MLLVYNSKVSFHLKKNFNYCITVSIILQPIFSDSFSTKTVMYAVPLVKTCKILGWTNICWPQLHVQIISDKWFILNKSFTFYLLYIKITYLFALLPVYLSYIIAVQKTLLKIGYCSEWLNCNTEFTAALLYCCENYPIHKVRFQWIWGWSFKAYCSYITLCSVFLLILLSPFKWWHLTFLSSLLLVLEWWYGISLLKRKTSPCRS